MAESFTLLCHFAAIHAAWPWIRQTEDSKGAVGPAQFVLPHQASSLSFFSTTATTPSAWFVAFDEAPAGFSTTVPRERRILFVTEPHEIKKYSRSFLGQFGMVLSPYGFRCVDRCSFAIGNTRLNWHFGVCSISGEYVSKFAALNDLRILHMPGENELVSVACSSMADAAAQRVWLGWALPLYPDASNFGGLCPAAGFAHLSGGDLGACAQSAPSAIEGGLFEARQAEFARCRYCMLEATNVFACRVRRMESASEYCRMQPALDAAGAIFGVDRNDEAAMYRPGRA